LRATGRGAFGPGQLAEPGDEDLHHQRVRPRLGAAQIDIGGQPYAMVARTIELLAGKVLPAARAL